MQPLFYVGKVVGFVGLKGALKVQPATNHPELLLDVKSVTLAPPNRSSLQANIRSLKIQKGMLIVTLSDFPDRNSVDFLRGVELYALKDQLRPLLSNQWWTSDLIGLAAFTPEGNPVGTICDVIESRQNTLLEIRTSDTNTALVPFVRELVPRVDIAAGRVEIKPIPGLLDPD